MTIADVYCLLCWWSTPCSECLNSDTQEWFDFNDASVSTVKKPELSSSTAYVLFFRRRQEQSLTI